jgi:outer membrane receptor protein involved in Fe transport
MRVKGGEEFIARDHSGRAAGSLFARGCGLLATVSAMTIAAMPHAAIAQTAPVADDRDAAASGDIVVIARKRAETLNKIPETIDVVTAEEISKAGIDDLNDVGRITPNVVLNRRQDNEPNVVIRGVGSFGNTQGVGFYIDDVQNFTDQSASVEDVERIEILKGPQGTLYGGSNVGGAIKYVMKKPGEQFGAQARVEYGSFDTANIFAALDVPLSDTLSTRLSGYFNRSDGFVNNVFLGGRPDKSEEWGVRGSVRWRPSADFTLDLSYRHNELRNGGNVYVVHPEGVYSREVDYNTDVANKRIVDGVILTATYDIGSADITSVTSYTRRKADILWDLDYSSADAITIFTPRPNKAKVFTQELRIASSGDSNFNWLLGAYYARIDDLSGLSYIDLIFGADAGGPILLPGRRNTSSKEEQKAVFGTLSYRLGAFEIGGGLRVGRSEYSAVFLNPPVRRAAQKDTKVLPKLTLAYDVAEDAMLYANLALGSEPGRINLGTADPTDPVPYRAEKAMSYELGLKGRAADRRLSYNLAFFYIDYKNRQLETPYLQDDGTILEAITNIGASKSYGVEAGLSYRATPELTLSASGGYLYSKWDDPDAVFNFVSVDGFTVPNAPKFSGSASIDYVKPMDNGLEVGLRADVTHMGSFYWDVLNTGKQPSYELVNLRVSLAKPEAGWEIAIRGENIFNAKYYNENLPNVFGPGASAGAPGRPATVMASFSLKY